jgi:hypothetical protein
MVSSTLILGYLPILALSANFLDSIPPQDKVAARVAAPDPQASDNGAFYCSAIGDLFSICDIGTVSQAATDAAGCLCYSSTSWAPQIFDGAVSSCADYAQTALPDAYTLAVAFEGFCTSVGDYQASPSPAARTTTPISPPTTAPVVGFTTSPNPTPIATTPVATVAASSGSAAASGSVDIFSNSACSYVSYAFDFCNSVSPGFSTMDATVQAPCLCYSSTSWDPTFFDGAVQTCADFVSTAEPSAYPTFAAVEGFCSSIGDVGNPLRSKTSTGALASATGGSGGGIGSGGSAGIGLTVSGLKSTSTPQSSKSSSKTPTTTTPVATTPVQSQAPAVTTIKSGDAPPNDSSLNWVFRLVFVAVSVVVLL